MLASLDGLSVGDALGAQFFIMGRSLPDLRSGRRPHAPWDWTDDTETACVLIAELRRHQHVDRDRLASEFARRFSPERDYGHATATTLRRIRNGAPWRETSAATFEGRGSYGNGAAMRVAPLGAYYWDDPQRVVASSTVRPGDAHAPRRRGRGGRRGRRGRAGRLCPPHPLSAHPHRIPHRRPGTSRTGRDDAWHLPGA